MALSSLKSQEPLSIIVAGASGDLAIKKIFPSLLTLYCQGRLPEHFHIVGFARTAMSSEAFREKISGPQMSCRYGPCEKCPQRQAEFLKRVSYVSAPYDSSEGMNRIDELLRNETGMGGTENRVFYLSVPPFLFLDVVRAIAGSRLSHRENGGWNRVVVEKPFGSDRTSSDELTQGLASFFPEDDTYRIDHYLGKEVIQNLMVLRFANLIFDPIWNRSHIEHVAISWTEDLGIEGRAGYFDQYGIIRDVMQNHLLQILALIAMEPPIAIGSKHVRDEKVKVLECIPPLSLDNLVVGQYTAGNLRGTAYEGYLQESGVPADSITPTYAAAVLHVRNRRWDGVPFLLRAGKGLMDRMTEIRIRFRAVPGNIFSGAGPLPPNELKIRVQPDAGIAFRIVNKVPGIGIALGESDLDLNYASAFKDKIPDAYECLLLDVIEGDRALFIRHDELEAAWDVFTPVLHALDTQQIRPRAYPFGGRGPEAADALAARYGVSW